MSCVYLYDIHPNVQIYIDVCQQTLPSCLNIVTDNHRKAYESHKCYLLLLYTYVIYTTLGEYYNSRMPNFYQIDQLNDKQDV